MGIVAQIFSQTDTFSPNNLLDVVLFVQSITSGHLMNITQLIFFMMVFVGIGVRYPKTHALFTASFLTLILEVMISTQPLLGSGYRLLFLVVMTLGSIGLLWSKR